MAYVGENPNFKSTILDDKGVAVVPNAPTGKTRIINRNGSLFLQDDTGTEKEVGTGGGGTNYVLNPDAEINESNDVTATNITLASETGSPLQADKSFQLTSLASVGECDWDITITDSYVTTGGILNYVTALLQTDANVASGDYTVGVYNVTDGEYATAQTDLEPDDLNVYQSTFVPVAGKTYVFRVEFTDTTAGRVLICDQFKMTPESSTAIQAFEQRTNWVDETVVAVTPLSGSVSYAQFRFSRDSNDQYSLEFNLFCDGMTAALLQSASLNLGGALSVSAQPLYMVGPTTNGGRAYVGGVGSNAVTQESTTNDTNLHVGGTILLDSKPSFFDDHLDDQKVNLITPNLLNSNNRSTWYRTTGFSITADGKQDILDTLVSDVGGWTYNAGDYLVPSTGYYRISFSFAISTVTQAGVLQIRGDGAFNTNNIHQAGAARTSWETGGINDFSKNGTTVVYLVKGDNFYVHGNDLRAVINPTLCNLSVERLADVGAHEPVGFGTATADTYGLVRTGELQPRENFIVNGGMDTWQRNTTFTTVNQFCADRMFIYGSGPINITRSLVGPTELIGSKYYMRWDSSATTADQGITYTIEEKDTYRLHGKTVTLSFYARGQANFDGTVTAFLGENTSEAKAVQDDTYGSQVMSVQNVPGFTRFSMTSNGPINKEARAISFSIRRQSMTAVGTNLLDLHGFKLEVGEEPTDFTYYGGSLESDFAACQRFYQLWVPPLWGAIGGPQTSADCAGSYPVEMRATPSYGQNATFNLTDIFSGTIAQSSASITVISSDRFAARLRMNNMAVMVTGQPYIFDNVGRWFTLDAEI